LDLKRAALFWRINPYADESKISLDFTVKFKANAVDNSETTTVIQTSMLNGDHQASNEAS